MRLILDIWRYLQKGDSTTTSSTTTPATTATTTEAPTPGTTEGSEAWHDPFLPRNLVPLHYDLYMNPDFYYDGRHKALSPWEDKPSNSKLLPTFQPLLNILMDVAFDTYRTKDHSCNTITTGKLACCWRPAAYLVWWSGTNVMLVFKFCRNKEWYVRQQSRQSWRSQSESGGNRSRNLATV